MKFKSSQDLVTEANQEIETIDTLKVKSLIDNILNIKTCFTGQHKDLLKNIDVDFLLSMEKELSENRLIIFLLIFLVMLIFLRI